MNCSHHYFLVGCIVGAMDSVVVVGGMVGSWW